ncbi:hypothetical protein ABG067_002206 [Albugo candida]
MQSSPFPVAPSKLEQAYKAIRVTPPELMDLEQSKKLKDFMSKHFPTENGVNITRRSLILAELRTIFRDWVKQVCIKKGVPEEIAADAGGLILVSGSYRLGVNEPGADIDTICVAPQQITREDFFTSLKKIFMQHSKVTNLNAIEGAVVPLLTFDYEEINIDLQIAILPRNTIPEDLNILNDQILVGVDAATEKSLNGPRVTELMIKLTPNRDSFISVLRIVRRWAKRRGLYSNKMGYLGGVNWCILVCFINQLYPTAAPTTLLLRFFMVLANWKWPLAIQLCKTEDVKLGLEVWNANVGNNRYHVMPILTPAYPSMNSSFNVSTHSLAVMKQEFERALKIVQEILNRGAVDWDPLFESSDFFAVQQHYLAVDVYTTNREDEQAWCGFCESRIRKLIESLAYIPMLCHLRAFPKRFPLSFADEDHDENIETPTDRKNDVKETSKYGACFYVGFDIDRRQLRSREVSIDSSVDYFKHNDLYRWNKRSESMDVRITPVLWKNLPEYVFEEMGGRVVAKSIRREYLKRKKEEERAAEEVLAASKTSTDDDTIILGNNSVGVEVVAPSDGPASGKDPSKSIGTENPAEKQIVVTEKRLYDEVAAPKAAGVSSPRGHVPSSAGSDSSIKEYHLGSQDDQTVLDSTLSPMRLGKQQDLLSQKKPPSIASPRKRRKMKITFAKLN